MFTVIIPLYNKEKYIKRALVSVLNQSYDNFEVIIVNDGSSDKSLEVLSDIKDNRLKLISQENLGVSSARNKGIKYAQYNYIAFLDADDVWHQDFLSVMKDLISSNLDARIYYSNYKLIKKKNEEHINYDKSVNHNEYLIDNYFDFVLKNKTICASSVVIEREVFINVGKFPEDLKRGEDLYLWTKIALKYKVAYTDFIGAFYYRNIPDSLTKGNFSIEHSFSNIAEEFYLNNKYLTKYSKSFREYMIQIIISKSIYLLKQGKKHEARALLSKYTDTKFHKSKIRLLYILSYLPKTLINTFT